MINLVFDYDGTLHDSMRIYAPSFRECCSLMRRTGLSVREYSDEEIKRWIGMDVRAMWDEFQPNLAESEKKKYGDFIGSSMIRLINEGKAALYDGVLEMLEELKSRYTLIFLSSCKRDYMYSHIKAFGLDRYFTRFCCTEDYGFAPKYRVIEDFGDIYEGQFIVIGDRYSDIEAAKQVGAMSIGCLYGYGTEEELKDADIKVRSIAELKKALE